MLTPSGVRSGLMEVYGKALKPCIPYIGLRDSEATLGWNQSTFEFTRPVQGLARPTPGYTAQYEAPRTWHCLTVSQQ
jgi:hypothetical protein